MSELDDYARGSGFTPTPAVRRLIAKVRTEASTRSDRGELGAWMFTFARLASMTETELKERGCPGDLIEPLMRFATERAVTIAAPIATVTDTDQEMKRQTGNFIARIAGLEWGTEAAMDAFREWLKSGFGHYPAEIRQERRLRELPEQERRQ